MESKVSVGFLRNVIYFAASKGASVVELCETAGITPEFFLKPDEKVPAHLSQRVWRKAEELTKDADIGLHLGEQIHPSTLGLVGFVMLSCERLGGALEKLLRYTNLLTDGVAGRLSHKNPLAEIEIEVVRDRKNILLETPRQPLESSFSTIATAARILTGKPLPIREMRFIHPRPLHISEHKRIFNAPILFSQETNKMVFASEALDYPVLLANRDLLPAFEAQAEQTVLRKMYIEDNPKLYDGQPGMRFTVNGIRKELKKQGKTRSHTQVIESLLILKGSQISCQNLTTKTMLIFNPIDVLSFKKHDDPDTPCYLIFSNIVAEALDNLYFRRFNYKKVVAYKTNIARLLHRRISHHFTQSNPKLTYSVNFSTLLRDFGLEYPTLAKAYIKLKEALKEMKNANVIQEFTCESIHNGHDPRKIDDYFIKITPTKAFSFEVKNSNDVRANILEILEGSEEVKKVSVSKKSKKSSSIFPKPIRSEDEQG